MMAEYNPPDSPAFAVGRALWTSGVRVVCNAGQWLAKTVRNIIINCQKSKCITSSELEKMATGPETMRLVACPTTLSQKIMADMEKMKVGENFKETSEVDEELEEEDFTKKSLDHYMFYRYHRHGFDSKRPTIPLGAFHYDRY